MPIRKQNGGRDERSGLVNVEYPRNALARIARLEDVTSLPTGGVRGGGDPDFGYRLTVPLIIDVTPHVVWDGTRHILSIVPTGFRYIEAEIDGDQGFHASPTLSPYTAL